MQFINNCLSIYYNLLSIFYICLNSIFPYYSEDILKLQYKVIENINDNIVFKEDYLRKKRVDNFIEKLIYKNHEIIEKIKQQEEDNNNLQNYDKIEDDELNDELSSDEDIKKD